MKKITTTIILIGTVYASVFAQLSPTKLSVFSNGTFFEQKEGNLKFKGNASVIELPGTVLKGTFWLATDKAKIKQVDVKVDTVKKDKNAVFLDDFLQANEGKNVTLRFKQYTAVAGNYPLRSLTGVLERFFKTTGLIKLKTPEGKVQLIYVSDLSDADFDANANDTFKDDTLIRRATILLDKNVTEAPFTQVTMQTGLQWQPSYYIKLENDKEAKIIMKATVENDTENSFDDIDLNLVVGAPQMYYGTQTEPLCDFYLPPPDIAGYTYQWDYGGEFDQKQTGATFRRNYYRVGLTDQIGYGEGAAASQSGTFSVTDANGSVAIEQEYYEPPAMPDGSTRNIQPLSANAPAKYGDITTRGARNESFNFSIDAVNIDITGNKDYSAEGKKSADLYYYNAGKATLPKNTKTVVPISQSTIPYKHIYEVTIGDITNYVANMAIVNPEPTKVDVYHSLKLTNKTTAPLTDASVFVVSEKEDPMAQDKMPYTPIGEEVSIKLSRAIDITVKNKEEENGREEKTKKFNKKSYDKVTLKGSIDVSNFLDKAITLNVKKALRGEVTKVDDGGTVVKPGRFTAINPVSLIKWDVDLKPGEKKTIVYQYEVYVNPQ